jgi:excisionase family DNA binding protein
MSGICGGGGAIRRVHGMERKHLASIERSFLSFANCAIDDSSAWISVVLKGIKRRSVTPQNRPKSPVLMPTETTHSCLAFAHSLLQALPASIRAAGDRSNARATVQSRLHTFGVSMAAQTSDASSPPALGAEPERLAYSIHEAAKLLGVDYFSVYRLIQRGKLRACRVLRGKLLVPRSELLRLLNS